MTHKEESTMRTQFWSKTMKARDLVEDTDVDGRITLK
jgi:hypothetical protein